MVSKPFILWFFVVKSAQKVIPSIIIFINVTIKMGSCIKKNVFILVKLPILMYRVFIWRRCTLTGAMFML